MIPEFRNRVYIAVQHRLRTIANGRVADMCRPVSPMLLITERCNARCLHCNIWKNKGAEETPAPGEWKAMLRELRDWLGPVHVVFTGGEALLRPYATDLVAHASALGLLPEVLTHGYWIDQSRIEKLAAAQPWRITMSLDGLGPIHSKVRGREDFFERSHTSLRTLLRMRREKRLKFRIRLKTVLMAHNLDEAAAIAHFASGAGADVFYQPIEQNYNTADAPNWFCTSQNWPKDTEKAVATILGLIALKQKGLPIANSSAQLRAMIDYFQDPGGLRIATQSHCAHEKKPLCAGLTNLEVRANGDVYTCHRKDSIGNIRTTSLQEMWAGRPKFWQSGCCLATR